MQTVALFVVEYLQRLALLFTLSALCLFTIYIQVGEARALYNIGNVFHAKGKQQLWGCTQEPGDLPPDVRETLQRATGFYEYALLSNSQMGCGMCTAEKSEWWHTVVELLCCWIFHFIFIRPQNVLLHALSASCAFWQTAGSCLPLCLKRFLRANKSASQPSSVRCSLDEIFAHSWRALQCVLSDLSLGCSVWGGQQPFINVCTLNP